QQRGLAAARRAQQGKELAAADVEREVVDGPHAPEVLRDAADGNVGLGARRRRTHRERPPTCLGSTPRRRMRSARITTRNETARMQLPSASTPGSRLGKRSWLQMKTGRVESLPLRKKASRNSSNEMMK